MRRVLSAAIAITTLVVAPTAHGWAWPVDGPVVRPFALAADPYAAGQHRGIDIGAVEGAPVRAPASGTVSFVGGVPSGGRAITILTPEGLAVTLLQLGSTAVTKDATVEVGAAVGTVGASADGVTTEPHVHLGVRESDDPNGYLDPLAFLPSRPVTPAPPEPSSTRRRRRPSSPRPPRHLQRSPRCRWLRPRRLRSPFPRRLRRRRRPRRPCRRRRPLRRRVRLRLVDTRSRPRGALRVPQLRGLMSWALPPHVPRCSRRPGP